jgi:hypothetical protein
MIQIDTDGENEGGDSLTYAIIGSAMEVHRQLGHGFLEIVHQEALALELTARGAPFQRELELPVSYTDPRTNLRGSQSSGLVGQTSVCPESFLLGSWTD